MKLITSLRGKCVALTGRGDAPRDVLIKRIRRKGGIVVGSTTHVTSDTDLLIRGCSSNWKHKTYGVKEVLAAELIRTGKQLSIVLAEDLSRLLEGRSVNEYWLVAGHDVEMLRAEAIVSRGEKSIRGAATLPKGALEGEALIATRLEQPYLRHLIFGRKEIAICSLCGRELPPALMVAAHIKPRARCTDKERRDIATIVMPLCKLGCDDLYERGYVTVASSGHIVTSKKLAISADLRNALAALARRRCKSHTPESEKYFLWHRTNVFF